MSAKTGSQSRIDRLEQLLDTVRMSDFSPITEWQAHVEKLLTAVVDHISAEHNDRIRETEDREKAEAEYDKGGDL